MTYTCVYCDEKTTHETWRHYGTKCVECKFLCVFRVCQERHVDVRGL